MRHRCLLAIAFVFAIATSNAIAAPFQTGDFITYSQGSWGGDPATAPAAQLVLAQFDGLYTGGLEVGVSGLAGFSMSFTGAVPLLVYLPGTGSPNVLTADLVDPTSTGTGVTGGEVVALTLNVDFSDANYLTGTAGIPFGDLVLTDLLPTQPFNGLTIRQFLAVANSILGQGSSNPTTDDEFVALLEDVNRAFASGMPSQFAQDHLLMPTESVPEPATLSLLGMGVAVLTIRRVKRRS
jgi:hypothetical protein